MRFSTPILRQDHSQPLASISVPPAASTYRASGLVLWHICDIARYENKDRFQSGRDIGAPVVTAKRPADGAAAAGSLYPRAACDA
jgi:hypothetical protein